MTIPFSCRPTIDPQRYFGGVNEASLVDPLAAARMLRTTTRYPKLRAELRAGSLAATSPTANTSRCPGTRRCSSTFTNPNSSSMPSGRKPELGRTSPIDHSTRSATNGS